MTPVRLTLHRLVRSVLVAVMLCLPCIPPQQASDVGEMPVSGLYPEVRLRKLHLVRPDLIPYPIAYEVCC